MTTARNKLVYENERGVYHCTVRCVRRAFLCGVDAYTGRDYSHRKEWIRSRLEKLSKAFGMDVFAYAVMSNHMHVVVRTRPDAVEAWTDEEVAHRWLSVYVPRHGPPGEDAVYEVTEEDVERLVNDVDRVLEIRRRLRSLSWFMKALNEHISRRANREDECKGRFWESRFKCQRIVDEAGLLACMCYVDLNPVRAKLAESLEDSEFTSIYDRIMAKKAAKRREALKVVRESKNASKEAIEQERIEVEGLLRRSAMLVEFEGKDGIFSRITEQQYFEVVDWTGRQIREGKRGQIGTKVRPVLESLELDADEWIQTVEEFSKRFCLVAGTIENIRKAAERVGRRWLKGCRSGRLAFVEAGGAVQAAGAG